MTEPPALLQKQVCAGQYGPGMAELEEQIAELEEQIAELNILQNEIDDQGEQLGSLVGPVGEPGGCHIRGQPQPLFFQSEPELDRLGPGDRGG